MSSSAAAPPPVPIATCPNPNLDGYAFGPTLCAYVKKKSPVTTGRWTPGDAWGVAVLHRKERPSYIELGVSLPRSCVQDARGRTLRFQMHIHSTRVSTLSIFDGDKRVCVVDWRMQSPDPHGQVQWKMCEPEVKCQQQGEGVRMLVRLRVTRPLSNTPVPEHKFSCTVNGKAACNPMPVRLISYAKYADTHLRKTRKRARGDETSVPPLARPAPPPPHATYVQTPDQALALAYAQARELASRLAPAPAPAPAVRGTGHLVRLAESLSTFYKRDAETTGPMFAKLIEGLRQMDPGSLAGSPHNPINLRE